MSQNEIARATVDLDGSMAGEELKKLTLRAKELRDELVQLGEKNDLGGFRQKEKELKLVNGQMKGLKTSTDAVTQVLKNLNGSSLNELLRAQRQLNAEIKASHRNTKEELAAYNEKIGSLKRINAEISKVNIESRLAMKSQQSWLSTAATGMNKYFAIVSAGIATLTGVVFSIKSFIQGNVELDDAMADVMKTTGLTKIEVRELYSEFKNFNTRTARKELLALAEEAGRLGMSSKKDIMGFVEVANQIKIALGDELGGNAEEAIREVGKLTNVYKVAEKYGVDFRQSMLMVGSAINQVAASGQSEAGYLIDLTKRLAGVSSQAGISVQDIIGYAAALDEMGQTSEVSSTTLNKIIVSMFKDVETYANLAQMSMQDFTDLLQTDANEALLKVLTGLNGNNVGLAVMATKLDGLGLDGARSVQILAALAGNIDLVRKYQDISNESLEKGTSLTNEYNIKNNNLAGNVEKIGRVLRATFVNSGINKALTDMINNVARWIEIPVSRTMEEQRIKVNMLTIELTNSNTQEERRKKVWEELNGLAPEVLKGITQESINIDLLRQNLERYNDEAIRKIALQRASEELTKVQEKLGKTVGDRARTENDLMAELVRLKQKAEWWDKERSGWIGDLLVSDGDVLDKEFQINDIIKEINKNQGLNVITGTNAYNLAYDVRNLREEENKLLEDSNKELSKYEEMYKSIMGTSAQPVPGGGDDGGGGGDDDGGGGGDDDGGGGTPKLDKKLQELLQKQDEFRLQLIIESKSLIEQEEIAYQERLKNAGIFGKKKENLTGKYLEAYYILEQQHNANILKINDQAYSDELLQNKELFDRITVNRQIAHNNELAAIGNNEEAKAAAEKQFQENEIERQQRFLGSLLAELQATIDKGSLSGLDDKLLSEEQKEQLRIRIDQVKLMLSELGIQFSNLKNPKEGEDAGLGPKKSSTDIFGMTPEDWQQLIDNIEAGEIPLAKLIEMVDVLANAWGYYYDIKNNLDQQDLTNFQASSDKKKQKLQNQLDQGIISQDQYHKGVAQLDSELDKKKKELAIKQAKREKTLGIVSAIINTAAGIVKGLNNPFPLNIIVAALVGVMGGLQIAKIATTPIPQYASGKYPVIGQKDGKTYNAGVINSPGTGLVNSPAILVGEKPEIIIDPFTTRKMQVNFPHIIEAINAVHAGRIPQFASGLYPTIREINTKETMPGELTNILDKLSDRIDRLTLSLDKGINAKLVANGDYIEMHNKVAEDYDVLKKESSLRG